MNIEWHDNEPPADGAEQRLAAWIDRAHEWTSHDFKVMCYQARGRTRASHDSWNRLVQMEWLSRQKRGDDQMDAWGGSQVYKDIQLLLTSGAVPDAFQVDEELLRKRIALFDASVHGYVESIKHPRRFFK